MAKDGWITISWKEEIFEIGLCCFRFIHAIVLIFIIFYFIARSLKDQENNGRIKRVDCDVFSSEIDYRYYSKHVPFLNNGIPSQTNNTCSLFPPNVCIDNMEDLRISIESFKYDPSLSEQQRGRATNWMSLFESLDNPTLSTLVNIISNVYF